MADSYYDLDAVLVDDEQIPVIFRVGATGIGRALDPSCDDDDLKKGAQVDLPLWMVQPLAGRNMIDVRLPRCYRDGLRKEMQADPGCVRLRECCQFFYKLGCKLVPLVKDRTLGTFVQSAYQGRYKDILVHAHSAPDKDISEMRRRLTNEEFSLMESGQKSMQHYKMWRLGEDGLAEIAPILGKRRRPSLRPL
eukprot:SM000291S10859  [mRNA]  locus=s291:33103:34557:+ [translate_table: standard]